MRQFEQLEALTIFCPQCRQAMPVRKRLLLVLLDQEIHEHVCARCGTSVAKKNEPLQPKPLNQAPGGPRLVF